MSGLRVRIAGVFAPRERELFALLEAGASNALEAAERLEIRTRAQDGENLARAGLAELFSEDPAPIELVRWKDLFERLQGALEASRDAAAALDVIAAKQR
jgi:uncharacterized protein Yka (UPF0111/DUF47 family)